MQYFFVNTFKNFLISQENGVIYPNVAKTIIFGTVANNLEKIKMDMKT
jgi:hypothetical protein